MSKYSEIDPSKFRAEDTERYHGTWLGMNVDIKRMFRGHYLTDEECAELCRGGLIEIHNIAGEYGKYAVVCRLARQFFAGVETCSVKAADTVPNRPDYSDTELHRYLPQTEEHDESIEFTDDDLRGIYFEETGDILARQKMQYEAALNAVSQTPSDEDDYVDEDVFTDAVMEAMGVTDDPDVNDFSAGEDDISDEPDDDPLIGVPVSGFIDESLDEDFDHRDFDDE